MSRCPGLVVLVACSLGGLLILRLPEREELNRGPPEHLLAEIHRLRNLAASSDVALRLFLQELLSKTHVPKKVRHFLDSVWFSDRIESHLASDAGSLGDPSTRSNRGAQPFCSHCGALSHTRKACQRGDPSTRSNWDVH